jgi:hypothetical protein
MDDQDHSDKSRKELDSNLVHQAPIHPVELDSTTIQAEMDGAGEVERAYENGSQSDREIAENGLVI